MCDLKTLLQIIQLLKLNGINVIIIGGWAEELTNMIPPREHKDIDLISLSENFDLVDKLLLNNHKLREIPEKHFHHKRAFIYQDVMIELFLVQKDNDGFYTNFWKQKKHFWLQPLSIDKNGLMIATTEILKSYRQNYDKLKFMYEC